MLKSILKWSFTIEDRQIDLFLDNDTPLSNVRELANYLLNYCQQIEDQVKAQQEAEKQKECFKKNEVVDELHETA